MNRFAYKGRDSQGQAVSGVVEAVSELAAAEQLMRRGVMPTELKAGKARSASIDWSLLLEGSVKLEELVVFSRQMYAPDPGRHPYTARHRGLEESAHSKPLKRALHALGRIWPTAGRCRARCSRTRRCSAASSWPSSTWGNTGQLERPSCSSPTISDLELGTRKRIKTAMRYPTFVLIAIAVAMVILNIMVIPVFCRDVCQSSGVELPLATRIPCWPPPTSSFTTGGCCSPSWWAPSSAGDAGSPPPKAG